MLSIITTCLFSILIFSGCIQSIQPRNYIISHVPEEVENVQLRNEAE
jgi:PBP1b-binding outer membrane lipoprotein LpoB